MAENEQDVAWFGNWAVKFDHQEMLGSYIRFVVGEFDSDGKLEIFEEEYEMKDVDKGGYCFIETNSEEHSGEEGQVVGVNIRSQHGWIPEKMMQIVSDTYTNQLLTYNKWKDMLKTNHSDRYKEVIEWEKNTHNL